LLQQSGSLPAKRRFFASWRDVLEGRFSVRGTVLLTGASVNRTVPLTELRFLLSCKKKGFGSSCRNANVIWAKLPEGVGFLIQMTDVSKVYSNGSVALSDVSVNIAEGDFVFVVGPSGAGKSTFIKLIFREEWPTNGHIIVNGRNITELSLREVPFLRRGLGIVFQDYRLLPNKSVHENVAFAMEVIETPRREIQKRVNHVLELVGLRELARNLPSELSGGEQQRVAIARAIVNKPRVVIADEPTGNLDPDTSWEIMKIFEKINEDGTTLVMATHDKTVVDAMKRRVIAIEKGRIVRDEAVGVYGYEG